MRFIFQTFLSFFLLASLSVYFFSSSAFAVDQKENYSVIINQVRGESCCSVGSVENTKTQLEIITSLGLKASFAVRYDALQDTKYTSLIWSYLNKFPSLIEPAALIEIIPSLAKDAGVTYGGNEENWFHAQYAYTMGYEKEDRKKILDTYMAKFRTVFGKYPKTSSAWMIDTESANYLHEKYGVMSHQITREQWGTDSYTLYGGPFHYPYPASNKWIFLPEYGQKNPLLVLRQTVTDPLYNYGDTNSQSTSQPNDYARAGRDISYFKSLISNAFSQPGDQSGFILLGLENSMAENYQIEFAKQLDWLSKNLKSFNALSVFANDANLLKYYSDNEMSIYYGRDNDKEAWNITTANYRARLISKNSEIFITDLRFYDIRLTDPYKDSVAKYEAFWIVPFAIDGSRWYLPKKGLPAAEHYFLPPHNDFASTQNGLKLDIEMKNTQTLYSGSEVNILGDKNAMIVLSGGEFSHTGRAKFEYLVPKKFPVIFKNPEIGDYGFAKSDDLQGTNLYSLNIFCTEMCVYDFDKADDIKKVQNIYYTLYPYYLPEPVGRNLSVTHSKITTLNRFAIAKRNPVRIMLEPHDNMNFPILLSDESIIKTENDSVTVKRLGDLKKSQYQYTDFYSEKPLSSKINVIMHQGDIRLEKNISIFFAPNCKEDFGYCLKNPIQGVWYVITKISDWWEGRR